MKQVDRSKSGAALITVILLSFIAVTLATTLLAAAVSHRMDSARLVSKERAQFIAEAGVERAVEYIEDHDAYLPDNKSDHGKLGDGTYQYTITKTAWRTYRVDSIGTFHGVSRTVFLNNVYVPTFAKYALWMDVNGRIYFTPGEQFFGHVHSNDQLWFYSNSYDGGPEFWENVTSGADIYGGDIDYVSFHKDFELNAMEGSLANVNFDDGSHSLKKLADDYGIILEGETRIEFDADRWQDGVQGVMLITNEREGWDKEPVPVGIENLVYVKNSTSGDTSTQKATLQLDGGDVRGKLTVVAEDDIHINDHLRYATNPVDNPDSTDALGIVSKDDIWVSTSAPNDLDIYAAMMAAGQIDSNDGSFGVLSYNQGATRGGLNVHGSIIQEKRGAVGTFNSSGPASGYYKNYTFDPRFQSKAPPYFPVVEGRIVYDSWGDGPA